MEKTGCKIICGAPTTLAVKGLMVMMIDGRWTFLFCYCFFLILFFFYNCVVPNGIYFSHGKFELLSPGKASCDRVALPNLRYMLCFLMFL